MNINKKLKLKNFKWLQRVKIKIVTNGFQRLKIIKIKLKFIII